MTKQTTKDQHRAISTTVVARNGYALKQVPVETDIDLVASLASRCDRSETIQIVQRLATEFVDLHGILGVPIGTLDRIHIRESPLPPRDGMTIVNLVERNDELVLRLRAGAEAGPKLDFPITSPCFAYGESEACQCSYCYEIDVKTHG